MHLAFVAGALALVLIAACQDLLTRTISDYVSIALLVGGAAQRACEGFAALGYSLLAAGALGIVLVVIFSRGMLGGGDVKLMGALAVGLPPASVWDLVVATALAGGAIACCYLAVRRLLPRIILKPRRPLLCRFIAIEAWRIRTGRSMPYAVAIAAGGLAVLIPGFGV